MALPNIARLEESIADKISDVVTNSVDKAVSTLKNVTDDLMKKTSGAFDEFKAPILKLKDVFAFNFSTRVLDRITGILPMWEKKGDRLEELVEELNTKTETGFGDTVNALNKVADQLAWQAEKDAYENEKIKDDSSPSFVEDEKDEKSNFSISGMFMGFARGFFSKLLRAIPIAAIAGIAFYSFKDLFEDMTKGQAAAAENGIGGAAANFQTIVGGLEGDIMSQFKAAGRWASAGFVAGLPFGGPIPGGLVGALIGGVIGAAVIGLQNWIGYEKFGAAVDSIVDKYNSAVEFFTGTDIERLERRIDELKKGRENFIDKATAANDEVASLEKQIDEQRQLGNTAHVSILEGQLRKKKESVKYFQDLMDSYDERIYKMEDDIKNADEGFIKQAKDFTVDTLAYVGTLPIRALQSLGDWITGGDWSKGFTDDHETFMKENFIVYFKDWSSRQYDNIVNWVGDTYDSGKEYVMQALADGKDFVLQKAEDMKNLVYDKVVSVGSFFTETIPETINDIIEGLKKKLYGAFEYVKDLGTAMYEEISFSDFNPFGSGPSYGERISERMDAMENSRRIGEEVSRVNANAEASLDVIKDSFDAALEKSVQNTNVSSVRQTNVSNNQFISRGMNPRNDDRTSILTEVLAGGGVISP